MNELLSHSFYEWLSYIRRRRHWNQFVFENIAQSTYEPIKRKCLTIFQKKKIVETLPAFNWMPKPFMHESLRIYNKISEGEIE